MSAKSKGYCFECNEYVDYSCYEEEAFETIKGKKVCFTMIRCKCSKCGGLVSVRAIDIENQNRISDAYKLEAGLLTSFQIREARKRLGLSAEQLAIELKMGRKNIARYETGSFQTRQIDQALRLFFASKSVSLTN